MALPIKSLLLKLQENSVPEVADLEHLLSLEKDDARQLLFHCADEVRRQHVGDGILLRGLIEFSNECRNACAYCGLNKNNKKLVRYRLSRQELLDCVAAVAASGIKTVVLQSGEDDGLDVLWLKDIIETIKQKYDMTVTLSVGERKFDDYKIWREAGADRFLLKIETTDKNLYESLHGGMSFENRIECLQQLKRLGFQTGSGIIVGLKNQTLSMIAKDIIFFKNQDFDMIGIGPFIPHPETLLMREPLGAVDLTLKVVALTRIVTKNAHLPATTALGSLQEDFRIQALEVGANVLMPNFTPQPFRKFFEIYPNKRCIDEPQGVCASCMEPLAKSIGRSIDYSRGDSFKKKNV